MIDFITVLSVVIFVRSSFLMIYDKLAERPKYRTRDSFLYRYYLKNINPWVYRLWGLSILWLIIQYKDLY